MSYYYTDIIGLTLGRNARTAEGTELAVGEHRGTRVRAGTMGDESFAPSPKVTIRWETFDAARSGRSGGSRVSDRGMGGAHGKSKRGFLHHGMPHQNFASSQNSKLSVN